MPAWRADRLLRAGWEPVRQPVEPGRFLITMWRDPLYGDVLWPHDAERRAAGRERAVRSVMGD